MATKIQYDIFKQEYDEENERLSELSNKAKVYLSIITFLFSSLVFKLDLLIGVARNRICILWLFILSMAFLMGALFTTIMSLKILIYEGCFDPEKVINNFQDKPPQDSEFLDDRIADLTVAYKINYQQNEVRASWLQGSGMLLSISFVFLVLFIIFVLLG